VSAAREVTGAPADPRRASWDRREETGPFDLIGDVDLIGRCLIGRCQTPDR
jgi:hypothetical protein